MASIKKCCGCFDLATGSKIIGGIVAITSIFSIIYCIISLASQRDVFLPSDEKPITEDAVQYVLIIFGISLAIEILIGVTGILVIVGVNKENGTFLIPYLIVSMIVIVLTFFFYGIGIFGVGGNGIAIFVCLLHLFYGGVQLYWWLCVRAHYLVIRRR